MVRAGVGSGFEYPIQQFRFSISREEDRRCFRRGEYGFDIGRADRSRIGE